MSDAIDAAMHAAEFDAALAAVPQNVRHRAFTAALTAFDQILREAEVSLGLFERMALLEECLDYAHERFNAELDEKEIH